MSTREQFTKAFHQGNSQNIDSPTMHMEPEVEILNELSDTVNNNVFQTPAKQRSIENIQSQLSEGEKSASDIMSVDKVDPIALVKLPIVMQIDESLMMLGDIESPNKALHDIVTHKVDNRLEDTVSSVDEDDFNTVIEDLILKDTESYQRGKQGLINQRYDQVFYLEHQISKVTKCISTGTNASQVSQICFCGFT